MNAKLRFDGGGQAPGPISGGVVIERDGHEPVESSFALPTGTHNVAEYMALEHGLDVASELGITSLSIFGDSLLIVQQVQGEWKCKQTHLRPLLAAVQERLAGFESWTIQHVRRELNKDADRVASEAITALQPGHRGRRRAY
jgi:ribonuclease HI